MENSLKEVGMLQRLLGWFHDNSAQGATGFFWGSPDVETATSDQC
jgi:hypothetical protein